jgi:hypothetical protein
LTTLTSGSSPPAQPVIEVPADEIAQRLDEIRAVEATFSDDFRSDSGLWANPDYDDVTFAYARGAYYITVEGTNITPASTGDVTVTDFLLEVEAAQTSGPAGQYGLFFRQVDDDNFYLFTVSPAQSYTLWEMVDGEWNELIPWTDAEAILGGEGEVNRLGVLAEGALITLLVNDTPLAQYTDDTFASGNIALAAGTFDEGGVEVEFDNVEVWLIE